jgi:hypothetical protein
VPFLYKSRSSKLSHVRFFIQKPLVSIFIKPQGDLNFWHTFAKVPHFLPKLALFLLAPPPLCLIYTGLLQLEKLVTRTHLKCLGGHMMTKKLYSLFFVAVALICVAPVSAGKAETARRALTHLQPYAYKMRELATPHQDRAQELLKHAAEMLVRDYVQKGLVRVFSGKTPKTTTSAASEPEHMVHDDISALTAQLQEMSETTEMQTERVKALCAQSEALIRQHEERMA